MKKVEMKLLFLLIVEILVLGSASRVPLTERPSDPVVPTDKDPVLPTSSDSALSPGDSIQVVHVHHQDLNNKILIGLIASVSLLGGILLLLICFWVYRHNKLKKFNSNHETSEHTDSSKGLTLSPFLSKLVSFKPGGKKGSVAVIEYQLLIAATNNFHKGHILGEGGAGCVYKAYFNDKFHAAVKKLHGAGQDTEREFQNEVDLLSKIRHQNVVTLLGYCIHDEMRFLIYEFMPNGSLDSYLHGPSRGRSLTWHLRMKIALDIARGLEYLHEHCIPTVIHRDLKSSNILLDANFNAKLSDFGLAITAGNLEKSDIKVSGTLGYVAPEYILDGKLTDKSDVYAFGVVLLELLTGRRPVENVVEAQRQSLVAWAMPLLKDRSKLPNSVDPVIKNTMDLKHLYQVAAVAVLCVQTEPSYRPLITDVLHSFIPLVPVELGGSLKVSDNALPPLPGRK